jgi:hypothetical protein
LNGFAGEHDLPKQQGYTYTASDNSPHGPVSRFFRSLGSAPLGAKVTFSSAFWIMAGGALHYGTGELAIDGRRRLIFIILAIAIGLIPLFLFWQPSDVTS